MKFVSFWRPLFSFLHSLRHISDNRIVISIVTMRAQYLNWESDEVLERWNSRSGRNDWLRWRKREVEQQSKCGGPPAIVPEKSCLKQREVSLCVEDPREFGHTLSRYVHRKFELTPRWSRCLYVEQFRLNNLDYFIGT